jgi:hypothetical protein
LVLLLNTVFVFLSSFAVAYLAGRAYLKIDPKEAVTKRTLWGGSGLLNIKARTELLGGKFEVQSAKGKGTTLRVSWPIQMRNVV